MDISPRSRVAGVLAALVLVSSAVSVMLPAASADAAVKTVNGYGTATAGHWQPTATRAVHGVTIHWHAVTSHHTITAYGGNWSFNKKLATGTTVSRVFPAKGVFRFYCQVHGYLFNGVCHGMCGKITIT